MHRRPAVRSVAEKGRDALAAEAPIARADAGRSEIARDGRCADLPGPRQIRPGLRVALFRADAPARYLKLRAHERVWISRSSSWTMSSRTRLATNERCGYSPSYRYSRQHWRAVVRLTLNSWTFGVSPEERKCWAMRLSSSGGGSAGIVGRIAASSNNSRKKVVLKNPTRAPK